MTESAGIHRTAAVRPGHFEAAHTHPPARAATGKLNCRKLPRRNRDRNYLHECVCPLGSQSQLECDADFY